MVNPMDAECCLLHLCPGVASLPQYPGPLTGFCLRHLKTQTSGHNPEFLTQWAWLGPKTVNVTKTSMLLVQGPH